MLWVLKQTNEHSKHLLKWMGKKIFKNLCSNIMFILTHVEFNVINGILHLNCLERRNTCLKIYSELAGLKFLNEFVKIFYGVLNWLQSLKLFFINMSYVLVASLSLMALF